MADNSAYLLRSRDQARTWMHRYGEFYQGQAESWIGWIRQLDYVSWIPLELEEKTREAVIGMLCLLYLERRINITFNRTVTAIRRDPADMDEYREWIERTAIQLRQRKK